MIDIGIHLDISDHDYFADPRISRSALWLLHSRTPAHYRAHEDKDTPALRWGRIVHTFILEPDLVAERYATDWPINPKTGKPYGRETKAVRDWLAASGKEDGLTPDEYHQTLRMMGQVQGHAAAKMLLAGEHEVTLAWDDPDYDLHLKARVDCVCDALGQTVLVDYKTCEDASRNAFARSAWKHGYYFQAAMYAAGWQTLHEADTAPPFALVAQEKTPPYAVAVRQVSPIDMAIGRLEWREAIAQMAACREKNEWPAYSEEVETIDIVPEYVRARYHFND